MALLPADLSETYAAPTRVWLERAVIGLNLCPFAQAVHVRGSIRWAVSDARTVEELLRDLRAELGFLAAADPALTETTLLIHPFVLHAFLDYNAFLDPAEEAIADLGLEGVIQLASFHPDYQFAGTDPGDITNHTNRSPYPILHLLREDSVSRAVQGHPSPESIPEANIARLRALGHEGWAALGIPRPAEHCPAHGQGPGRPESGT